MPPNDDPLPPIEWGGDFGSPHETFIASQFDKPVFVHHYPTAVKAFYMEPEPGRPEVCRSSDLLAPEGYGEIIGGSERMSDPEVLLAAIDRHGLPREAYQWYIDLRRYGSVPHSGFGLGVERTVSLDLRPGPHPRDHRLPANARPPAAVTSCRRGEAIGSVDLAPAECFAARMSQCHTTCPVSC